MKQRQAIINKIITYVPGTGGKGSTTTIKYIIIYQFQFFFGFDSFTHTQCQTKTLKPQCQQGNT